MAAKGEPSEVAITWKPSGTAVTLSPWLIHTGSRWSTAPTPANSGLSRVSTMSARPNSRVSPGSTLPPSTSHMSCSP